MSWFLFCSVRLGFCVYYVSIYLDGWCGIIIVVLSLRKWNRAARCSLLALMDFMIAREKKNYALCMNIRMVSGCRCRVLFRCKFYFSLLCVLFFLFTQNFSSRPCVCLSVCVCVYVWSRTSSFARLSLLAFICAN